MDSNYSVQIEEFAEKHFIKSFKKKYNSGWDVTLRAILFQLERIDNFLQTDKANTIIDGGDIKIIKTEFKIAVSKESAKTSGNRCIVAWHIKERFVSILLVYNKTDLTSKNNETDEWKNLVKDNYPKYKDLFK
jgi:predicted secreted hydrolase